MFCTHCGQQLPQDANFCFKCGKPQKAGVESFSAAPVKWEYCEVKMKEEVLKDRGWFTQTRVVTRQMIAHAHGPSGKYIAASSSIVRVEEEYRSFGHGIDGWQPKSTSLFDPDNPHIDMGFMGFFNIHEQITTELLSDGWEIRDQDGEKFRRRVPG